nr:uncharacterized protein LOC104110960 [Nicotiana tomentosiformis]XP_033515807.1 uncharacterized protein LOC104110960 [Nicotiana tomentosiformis]XP_033515808.1 uncharacterized protein LOC104110960 [Nicotiana tomentosiformis]XP_033515809.1 uncharacterized protein LOC104110960 [Nicotiana tomentosiformis]XP_033515810.1 uncharacterized protein LOC104110960 [Nicotiana tomentosiformis]XP_033515811.1 uncharacterized protein LOC104110960 [Nicotiana tomentosiformis]
MKPSQRVRTRACGRRSTSVNTSVKKSIFAPCWFQFRILYAEIREGCEVVTISYEEAKKKSKIIRAKDEPHHINCSRIAIRLIALCDATHHGKETTTHTMLKNPFNWHSVAGIKR